MRDGSYFRVFITKVRRHKKKDRDRKSGRIITGKKMSHSSTLGGALLAHNAQKEVEFLLMKGGTLPGI